MLMRRWEQAKAGDGSVVLIAGEPGIGKSRIAADDRWSGWPASPTRGCVFSARRTIRTARFIRASPSSSGRPAFNARIRPSNGWPSLRQCWLKATNDLSEAVPLLADLLVDPDRRPLPAAQSHAAEAQGEDASGAAGSGRGTGGAAAGADGVRGHPLERPNHAGVAATCLIDRVPTLRVLVIITFRPEFTPPWVGRPHVTLLSLNRLAPRQRAEMITT